MDKDSLIVTIAAAANAGPDDLNVDVTLAVAGFLVSGRVISMTQYCDEHPVSKSFADNLAALNKSTPESGDADRFHNSPNLIHLSDAQFFSGNGNAIPGGDSGASVRIQIAHIQAFFFGRLAKD